MSIRMGQLVWFDGGKGYLVPGTVVKSHPQGGLVVRSTEASEQVVLSLKEVRIRSDEGENGIEDMTKISDLHEGALIHNLMKRFKRKTIYTYVGSILIAVNPYEVYDIYGVDVVQQYEGQLIGKLPPHIFAVSSTSYVHMRSSGLNQCLIISGESGSGKTETTKLIIQYLASINKSPSSLISEQILEATPLLESFGNAKTVQNNNSSRFGKYLEIFFNVQGLITGAKLSEFLLEKSRIVGLSSGERNYHVFYEVLAGLGPSEKAKYGLTVAEDYLYLNQGKACTLLGKNDKEDFKRLCTAMEVLGILNEEQQAIFRILAAILHLGNIYFEAVDINGQEAAEITSLPQVQSVANLLSGSMEKFTKSLTHKTTVTRGEVIYSPINIEQALDTRDALARGLYAHLFTWLVTRINDIVCKCERHTSIAVLDIFGFENFEMNGFEQLCINFANEQLQFYFNQHIFKLEQEEYLNEGISWSTISYQDNQLCLDLLCKRPSGIIQLLDDESNFPKGTDVSFLFKCHTEHSKNPYYVEPRPSALKFGIRHYAALVWYNVGAFLDKNRDILRSDLIDLLNGSKNKLISTLFVTETATVTSSVSRKRLLSVASKFSQSLSQLVSTMSKCSPYFVRCIKPNSEKLPGCFNESLVMHQLRCLGVMETVHIRRLGFPIRVKFDNFLERYGCLRTGETKRLSSRKEGGEIAVEILGELDLKDEEGGYQVGRTKLFLRESTERALEEARAIRLRDAATTVQKAARGYLAKRRYQKQLVSAVRLQSHIRAFLVRKRYLKLRTAVVSLQSFVRMRKQRRLFVKMLDERRMEEEVEMARIESQVIPTPQGLLPSAPSRQVSIERLPVESTLDLPAEVGVILSGLVHSNDQICTDLAPVKGTTLEHEPITRTLPSNVDMCPFAKFAGAYFQEGLVFAMANVPLPSSLLKLGNKEAEAEAVVMMKMVMSFMQEPLTGIKDVILGNYIISKALSLAPLREELYTQVCNQVWCNKDEQSLTRGWLLFALCSGTIPPSELMDSYLINFSFHYAYAGYKAYCQHNLLRTSSSHLPRCRPPCLLEWRSARSFARTALEVCYPDGQRLYVPADSWTTVSDITKLMVQERNITSNLQGWTFQLVHTSQCMDLAGYGYMFDAISQLELPPEFPKGAIPHLITSQLTRSEDRSSKVMSWFVESLFAPVLEPEESREEKWKEEEEEEGKGKETEEEVKEVDDDDDEDDLVTDIDTMTSAIKSPPPRQEGFSKIAELTKQLTLECEDLLPPPPDFGGESKPPTDAHPPLTGYHAEILQSALSVKQLSAQMETQLSGLLGFSLLQTTAAGESRVAPSQDGTAPSKNEAPKITGGTEGKPLLRSQNSIGLLQKRRSRLSTLYRSTSSTGSGSLQADPVLDAPPPPTINVYTVPPLWTPPIAYIDPPWTLTLKKEYFNPLEVYEEGTVLDWAFFQVVRDTFDDGCLRMSEKDKDVLQLLFKKHGISESGGNISRAVKVEVVAKARELPCYFCCLFMASSQTQHLECSHVGVGHRGVVFIKQQQHNGSSPLLPVQQYSYDGIVGCVSEATSVTFSILCDDKEGSYNVCVCSDYASQIADLVSKHLEELETKRQYVMTVAEYTTFESTLLSFPKGAIIKLQPKAHLERGWLFGEYGGRVGIFPEEYSTSLISWGEAPSEKSVMRARHLLKATAVPKRHVVKKSYSKEEKVSIVESTKGLIEAIELLDVPLLHPLPSTGSPMTEFASKHFLLGQDRVEMIKKLSTSQTGGPNLFSTIRDTLGRKKKEQAETGDISEMLRFSKSPIPVSLLQLDPTNLEVNNLAVECFLGVMRFMGDYVLRGTLEDNIFFILKCAREHDSLKDEVYCQIIKQLTDNHSAKPSSCLRGWQLMYVCSAYFLCSTSLLPSLVHFLHTCTSNPSSPHHPQATMCEFNLRRTLRFGGRKDPPSTAELRSVIGEKYTRRQIVHLHGDCSKILRVKMSTVTYDILKEMCALLGFQREEEVNEYGLHVDLGENCPPLPLLVSDYITDMTSMLELRGLQYTIRFTKLMWNQPIKLQNSLCVDLLYFQAKADVLNGFLFPLKGGMISADMLEAVCMLGALQHRAEGNKGVTEGERETTGPTLEVTLLVPPSLSHLLLPSEWSQRVQMSYQSHVADMTKPDARKKYIKLASTLPLYGSKFFPIMATSDPALQGCSLLAVNKKGIAFLDCRTKVVLQAFPYSAVVSTRMLRSQDGKQFFDIKLGTLMQQTILRCETPYGREIGPLLGKYISLWAEQLKEMEEEAYGIAHGLSYL